MTDEELREIIDPVSSTLPLALLSHKFQHLFGPYVCIQKWPPAAQGASRAPQAAKMIASLLEAPGVPCPVSETKVRSSLHWVSTGPLKLRTSCRFIMRSWRARSMYRERTCATCLGRQGAPGMTSQCTTSCCRASTTQNGRATCLSAAARQAPLLCTNISIRLPMPVSSITA